MRNFYFLMLLGTLVSFSSCDKAEEVVGPQGPAGIDGVLTQGSISGTISGTRANGDELNESFNYNVYYSLTDSRIEDRGGYYEVSVGRGAIDQASYFYFQFETDDVTQKPDSSTIDLDFQFVKALNDGEYLNFSLTNNMAKNPAAKYFDQWSASKLTISNYSYSASTGQLKFDYVIDVDQYENMSGNDATVTGKVDVVLKKEVYKQSTK